MLVGRVPSRGAVLAFPSECEISGLEPSPHAPPVHNQQSAIGNPMFAVDMPSRAPCVQIREIRASPLPSPIRQSGYRQPDSTSHAPWQGCQPLPLTLAPPAGVQSTSHSNPVVSLRSTTGYRRASLRERSLAWLCWSSPEANPGGIGHSCPLPERGQPPVGQVRAPKNLRCACVGRLPGSAVDPGSQSGTIRSR